MKINIKNAYSSKGLPIRSFEALTTLYVCTRVLAMFFCRRCCPRRRRTPWTHSLSAHLLCFKGCTWVQVNRQPL